MNLQGGWALVRKSLFSYFAARGFFWTLAVGWMIGPLVYMFVWMTAAGQSTLGGLQPGEVAGYYLCLIAVNQFTTPVSNWTIGDVIRTGGFSGWLLRPIPAIYEAIATDAATKMVCMPFVLAVVVGLGLFLQPVVVFSWLNLGLFGAALLLAQALRFMLAYVLALLALWSDRADALLALNDTLVFLLAGVVAPLALLPPALQTVARALPYYYMIGFPIEVLLGQLEPGEIWVGFGWQLGWLLLIGLAHHRVWRLGLRRYTAVGG